MFAPFPGIPAQRIEWKRVENVTASPRSPLTGNQQVVARPGGAWSCSLTWENMRDSYRHVLMSWQSRLQGGAGYTYLSPHDRSNTGEPISSALTNYAKGINWGDNNPGNLPGAVTTNAGAVHNARPGKGFDGYIETLSAGLSIDSAIRFPSQLDINTNVVCEYYGHGYASSSAPITMRSAINVGGVDLFQTDSLASEGPQRIALTVPMSGANEATFRLFTFCVTQSLRGPTNTVFDLTASAGIRTAESALKGATAIRVRGYVSAIRDRINLIEGDYVEIDGQLVRLTSSSYVGSGGLAVIHFLPAIRRPTPASTAVIVVRPAAKMRLIENDPGHASRPYGQKNAISDFTMSFIEVID